MNNEEDYAENRGDDAHSYKVDVLNGCLGDQNVNMYERDSTSKSKNIIRAKQAYKESPSKISESPVSFF